MNYDERQLNAVRRYQSKVTAHQILNVADGMICIERNRCGKPVIENIPVSKESDFKIGQFVDLIILSNYRDGKETSFAVRVLGLTPPEFIPES